MHYLFWLARFVVVRDENRDRAAGIEREQVSDLFLSLAFDVMKTKRRTWHISHLFFGRLFDALHVSCPGGVREAPPGHQMGPPGGLRAPAEATLVVPRHPPDSCCAALACVAADGGTPAVRGCAANSSLPSSHLSTDATGACPTATNRPRCGSPARPLPPQTPSRIVVTFRRPRLPSGRSIDDGHAQLTSLVA